MTKVGVNSINYTSQLFRKFLSPLMHRFLIVERIATAHRPSATDQARRDSDSDCAAGTCRCWVVLAVERSVDDERMVHMYCCGAAGREELARTCGQQSSCQSHEAARVKPVLRLGSVSS